MFDQDAAEELFLDALTNERSCDSSWRRWAWEYGLRTSFTIRTWFLS